LQNGLSEEENSGRQPIFCWWLFL